MKKEITNPLLNNTQLATLSVLISFIFLIGLLGSLFGLGYADTTWIIPTYVIVFNPITIFIVLKLVERTKSITLKITLFWATLPFALFGWLMLSNLLYNEGLFPYSFVPEAIGFGCIFIVVLYTLFQKRLLRHANIHK